VAIGKKYLRCWEVAELLGVTPRSVRYMIAAKRLPGVVRIGVRTVLIRRREFLRWLREQEQETRGYE